MPKKPVYRPLEEKWRRNERGLSCLLSHPKQKEVTEEVQKAKRSSNQIIKGKGERMNAEAWRSVLAAQVKEKQKLTAPGIPRRVSHPSTNQARPCLASEIGRDRAVAQGGMAVSEYNAQMPAIKEDTPGVYFWKIKKKTRVPCLCFIGIKLSPRNKQLSKYTFK